LCLLSLTKKIYININIIQIFFISLQSKIIVMGSLKEKMYETKIKFLEKRIVDLEQKLEGKINLEIEKQNNFNLEKKQEVIMALEYLKSKEVKTKQDQISIYTLEVVLKGLK